MIGRVQLRLRHATFRSACSLLTEIGHCHLDTKLVSDDTAGSSFATVSEVSKNAGANVLSPIPSNVSAFKSKSSSFSKILFEEDYTGSVFRDRYRMAADMTISPALTYIIGS